MENKLKLLPKGWIETTIEDICTSPQYGYTTKADEKGVIKLLRTTDITSGKINWDTVPYCLKNPENPEKYFLKEGDIVISRAGSIGISYLITKPEKAVFASYLIRFNPLINKKHFKYFLESPIYWSNISEKKLGIAVQNVNATKLKSIKLPLPPLSEQHQIVAKIEELFSELDNGIENLKKAREQLKTYRRAVLKYAFEGKLTKQWRTQHLPAGRQGQAGNPPEPAELPELPELPEGWKWEQIKKITTVLGDGLHGTPIYSDEGDYYFINGNNLSDGKIKIKENTKRVTIEEYEKYKKPLSENTVLVSINGTLGNTAFYNGEKVILGKSACYFNVLNTIDKHYIRYCITSQRFINYAYKNATGSTIKNVSLKAMREFEIPIPPTLEEQQAIVSSIESRLSVCDKIEQTIEDSLKKAEALRQSILKKAFEGELTREWRLPAGRQEKNGEVYIVENRSGKLMPNSKEVYFVYVLECENGSIYKGVTSNLNKRINDHLAGIGAEWTKT
ncbi:MAG: restriction endonuclease subunit S, partial [candidate division Zixibacteria bacterium]|nr:restriction endonuclease subunit S [candidate division Zixibacteria bacterium]